MTIHLCAHLFLFLSNCFRAICNKLKVFRFFQSGILNLVLQIDQNPQ